MRENSRFNRRIKNLPEAIWRRIAQIDELKGRWATGASLSPQALGRLKQSVLVTSTGASTRIEGARLSDEEVEKLMRGIAVRKFRDRDRQEVRGYYELLANVFESWETVKFSDGMIKHFHKELLTYAEKDERHRGEYKKQENRVEMKDADANIVEVLFAPTPPYLTPKEMQELIGWTQLALAGGKPHPLLIIGNFIFEFLAIHPFQDGNGRLSRILTNLLLLQQGYAFAPYASHEKLVERHKADYYITLRRSQKTWKSTHEDITMWLNFFLQLILQQAETAVALLSKEQIEKLLSPKQFAVWKYIEKVPEATPGDIAQAADVARPTVNQALNALLRLNKIERIGLGRTTRYRKVT